MSKKQNKRQNNQVRPLKCDIKTSKLKTTNTNYFLCGFGLKYLYMIAVICKTVCVQCICIHTQVMIT